MRERTATICYNWRVLPKHKVQLQLIYRHCATLGCSQKTIKTEQQKTTQHNPKSHLLAIKLQMALSKNKNQTFLEALFLQTKRLPKPPSFMWQPLRATALGPPTKLPSMFGAPRKTAMKSPYLAKELFESTA